MKKAIPLLFVLAVACHVQAQSIPPAASAAANEAMAQFVKGGSREEYLAALKAIASQSGYQGWYDGLIQDLALPDKPPAGYEKKPEDRTAEEGIRAWIYELRDNPTEGFSRMNQREPSPTDRLVAAGPAAMDALIESAGDRTLTRLKPFRASFGPPTLLTRGALVCQIIGRIGAIRSAVAGGVVGSPDDLARWWAQAKGKSQADGLRIYKRQFNEEATYDAILALIEGSEEDVRNLKALQAKSLTQFGSTVSEVLEQLDLRGLVHGAMDRFWQQKTQRFDLKYITRYGDQRVYAEIARRIDAGTESIWAQDINSFLNAGGNWAIPAHAAIVAATLRAPPVRNGDTVNIQAANHAMEQLTRLTGQDFGHTAGGSSSAPQTAAYQKMKDWWDGGGKDAMKDKINESRPSPTNSTDLLDTEDQIIARVVDLSSSNAITARRAVATAPKSYCFDVQRALLARLNLETVPAERLRILAKFATAAPWQGPILAKVMENDADEGVRLATAGLIGQLMGNSAADSGYRLEPREATLEVMRRIAANVKSTPGTRLAAAHIMIQWGSFVDHDAIKALSNDAVLKGDAAVKSLLGN